MCHLERARADSTRRGRWLQVVTIAWNSVECGVALVGFGFDSAIEVASSLAVLSLLVMPVLARFKRRVATRLGSGALEAETRQTEICAYLSAILVVGLGLNAWLGWWWADPVAGLVMVPLIAREGCVLHRAYKNDPFGS
ncbi:MAG: cation transporter [Candidatus Rokubacteria bacterium]|nr:cation transporter [Candidatus Rokubacteria bacterium]